MSTSGDSPDPTGRRGRSAGPAGLINRLLLKVMGPAQITPADEQDRAEQQAHADHETGRHPHTDPPADASAGPPR